MHISAPPHEQNATQGQFLSEDKQIGIKSFPYLRLLPYQNKRA